MNFRSIFRLRRRTWRFLGILAGAIIIGLVQNWPFSFNVPDDVAGRARIIDGDSLRVAGKEVRLVGIDAPEREQSCTRNGKPWRCGRSASHALGKRIGARRVFCDVEGTDRYDRLLAVCSVGKREINSWMVQNGWAVAFGRYHKEEREARKALRGIWAGDFDYPATWRKENMADAVAAAAS